MPKAGCHVSVAALLFATAAHAGPPFVTDDPEPVEHRSWEVNYALAATYTKDDDTANLPQIDANYGVAPGVQLHVQPRAAFVHPTDRKTAYGYGDTELGVKYRLTASESDEDRWMVSLYPMLEVPTGSAGRDLGAGAYSTYLPIWLQTTRGRWTTFGGGGYWINRATGARNALSGGWVVLYQFTPRLQFGGEVFGATASTPFNDAANGRGSTGFNLGGTYRLAPRYNLLFSAGRGLTNVAASNQASFYLALQVLY